MHQWWTHKSNFDPSIPAKVFKLVIEQNFISPGNGFIDFDELRTVLKSCMGESTLQFSDDKLDDLTRALIEDADVDNSGTITFEELQAQLDKYPGVIENLTIRWDKTCSVTPTIYHYISINIIYYHCLLLQQLLPTTQLTKASITVPPPLL